MTTPRIGLNGRFSGTLRPTGTQTAAFGLFDALVRAPRDLELVIFADPEFPGVAKWFDAPLTTLVPVPFTHWPRSVSQLWEQVGLPLEARRYDCVLLHHPITTCSRWTWGMRQLVTVHDLGFYHHPEWVSWSFRSWLMATAVPGIRQAEHVVTISDHVLEDVRRTLGVRPERSSRIYNGFKSISCDRTSAASLEKKKKPVILALNAWQPHKNLPRLIEAFHLVRKEIADVTLRLAGRPQQHYRQQSGLAEMLEHPAITVLGYLSEEELAREYATATVLCYPSLEEGFGLPLLEAMSAGVPVVTSNVSCLPEIAGDAAVLVDPFAVGAIADGLRQVLTMSEAERVRRIACGREIAAQFSWEDSARQYLELYRQILSR